MFINVHIKLRIAFGSVKIERSYCSLHTARRSLRFAGGNGNLGAYTRRDRVARDSSRVASGYMHR